jgi:hypothetical protein
MAGTEIQMFENRRVMLMRISRGGNREKDVKNEGWTSEFIENKGTKKVVLRVCRKQTSYLVLTITY